MSLWERHPEKPVRTRAWRLQEEGWVPLTGTGTLTVPVHLWLVRFTYTFVWHSLPVPLRVLLYLFLKNSTLFLFYLWQYNEPIALAGTLYLYLWLVKVVKLIWSQCLADSQSINIGCLATSVLPHGEISKYSWLMKWKRIMIWPFANMVCM